MSSSKFAFDVECVAYDGKQFLFGPRWSAGFGPLMIAELTGTSDTESEYTFKFLKLVEGGTEFEPSFTVTIYYRYEDITVSRAIPRPVVELVANFARAIRLVHAGVATIRGYRD